MNMKVAEKRKKDVSIDDESTDSESSGEVEVNGSGRSAIGHPKAQSRKSRGKSSIISPFVSGPLVRRPSGSADPMGHRTSSEPSTISDVLAILSASASSHEPSVQNAALMTALSLIDARSTSESSTGTQGSKNPALVDALKQLLSAWPSQFAPQSTQNISSSSTNQPRKSSDDDIVILDKENVNPTAFRRRAEREREEAKLSSSSAAEAAGPPSRASRNLGVSLRMNEDDHAVARTAPASSPPRNAETARRKRTLSTFMEDTEYRNDNVRSRDRDTTGRTVMNSSRKPATESSKSHYRELHPSLRPSLLLPRSSPPRVSKENSATRPLPQVPPVRLFARSASSPVRSSAGQAQARRKYVVPEWARTETATQPRLSAEAELALEEEKKEKQLKKREQEKERMRKRYKSEGAAKTKATTTETAGPENASLPQAVVASSLLPVIASTVEISPIAASLSLPFLSEAASSSSWHPPATPPRKKRASTISTPGNGCSLFSPPPAFSSSTSSLFSPDGSTSLRNARVSLSVTERIAKRKESSRPSSETEESIEDILTRELDDALEDLGSRSDSSPVASSDIGTIASGRIDTDHHNDSELNGNSPKKQHWQGLPPSSPPTPSSPLPMSEDLPHRDDMDDLPLASSDTEDDFYESEATSPPRTDQTTFSEQQLAMFFNMEEFDVVFPPSKDTDDTMSGLDIFDQFTNHNALSSDGLESQNSDLHTSNLGMDPAVQNGLADFDFTQFWESMKPLVESTSANPTTETGLTLDFGDCSSPGARIMGELDHEKLAEEVHALFSGCLM